jgi:hypothetical protein
LFVLFNVGISIPERKDDNIMRPVDILFSGLAAIRAAGKCPTCGNNIGAFRDALSQKEFSISGMCQQCQDSVFAAPSDDEEDTPDWAIGFGDERDGE